MNGANNAIKWLGVSSVLARYQRWHGLVSTAHDEDTSKATDVDHQGMLLDPAYGQLPADGSGRTQACGAHTIA